MNVTENIVGANEIETITAPLAVQIGTSNKVFGAQSMRDAQAIWSRIRSTLMSQGLGNRDIPTVFLVDIAKQKRIGRISWNGCLWNEHGEEILP